MSEIRIHIAYKCIMYKKKKATIKRTQNKIPVKYFSNEHKSRATVYSMMYILCESFQNIFSKRFVMYIDIIIFVKNSKYKFGFTSIDLFTLVSRYLPQSSLLSSNVFFARTFPCLKSEMKSRWLEH